jgi:hypothetical protein
MNGDVVVCGVGREERRGGESGGGGIDGPGGGFMSKR